MELTLLFVGVCAALAAGYHFYGSFIAKKFLLNSRNQTPAARVNDGVDFVPTPRFYLLGQHFSAIAAAGPIAGPILACQQFGWVPCLLWIGFGVIAIGAVHDLSTLVASIRHDARSIAEIVKTNMGPRAWLAMIGFIYIALIYVIVAFADVTSSTFVAGDAELKGLEFTFHPGGAVAAASTYYLILAFSMGFVEKLLKPPLWLQTLIFVPATLGAVWCGTQTSTYFVSDAKTWTLLILAYCFLSSLLPVWSLLQPRGYLGGFVLYFAIAAGLLGILFGGFAIQQPAFTQFSTGGDFGLLFPFLFVTIACGACSGFHGLVCSGTTSKQIAKEEHCKSVGYGAMLLEALVAVIALTTFMIATPSQIQGKGPGAIYGEGLGRFLTILLGEKNLTFATTFGAMAFSTFVFDTLDVSTRLGRILLQEITGWKSKLGGVTLAAITCIIPGIFVWSSGAGSYRQFWTLFGTSNQLLAALSLLGITVWLKRSGKDYRFTLFPMVFIFIITITALVIQMIAPWTSASASSVVWVNSAVSFLLLLLSIAMLTIGGKYLFTKSAKI
ncbi:MAG: carbon starvation protein A [Planctomycetota bacterium]